MCLLVYTYIYVGYSLSMNIYVHITGVPAMVPNVTVDINTYGNNVTLTLSWGEPLNNLDPIVNYTVSCSGNVTCPPDYTTTDNTTRSYTITNLTPVTNYTFSVVATNSIGSGEAGVVMITIPGKVMDVQFLRTFVCRVTYRVSFRILVEGGQNQIKWDNGGAKKF